MASVDASPAAGTLAEIAGQFLPAGPVYNLAVEPWIDVTDVTSGQPRQVGLRDALLGAHTIALDAANRGPLWRYAMHRWLGSLTYLLHAAEPTWPWAEVAAGRRRLPEAAVDRLLLRLADHLWLHHPNTPFLQYLPALVLMDVKARKTLEQTLDAGTDPFWALVPDVPSKSNTSWFGRAHEQSNPTQADAANALLLRWCFALPGNEGRNRVAGGRSEGGATALTNHGRSLVSISGRTLSQTLTRNLYLPWMETLDPTAPTFFEAPDHPARHLEANRQWLVTATCAATVIIPAPHDPAGYRSVRTPMPWSKPITAGVKDWIAANDVHTLRTDSKTATQHRSYVKLPASGNDLDLVTKFHSDLIASGALHKPSVLEGDDATFSRHAGDVDVEVLVIEGAGSPTGPRISGTAIFTPPTGSFATARPDVRMSRYVELANRVHSAKGAASRKAAWYALNAIDPSGDSSPDGYYRKCDITFAAAAEPLLRRILHDCLNPETELPTRLSQDQLEQIRRLALEMFDEIVAPHIQRPSSIAHIVRQRRRLSYEFTLKETA